MNEMKKVLFMIPDLAGGGAEKVLVNLVNNMDREKFEITVKTLFDVGVNRDKLLPHIKREYCIKKQFRGNSKFFQLFKPETLFKRFIKEHYDIIVSYLEGPTARIVSGCTDNSTKLVSWIHCRMENESIASIGFRSFEEAKRCYNRFDFTACVSKWVKDYYTDVFSFSKPIGVIYNTIQTDEIIEKSKEAVDDITIDSNCCNICSVGRLIDIKGFDRLINIHKRLLCKNINNHIYIFGNGKERKRLEDLVQQNGLSSTFTFMGYTMNPYKYIKNMDLYVCSSYSEGFSTSVTEALIVGTPVVTTLCSGMKELLGENNEYGIVTENNEDALYEGIKKMLTTPGMLEDYAERAKERGKKFSTEKTVKAVEKMFEEL